MTFAIPTAQALGASKLSYHVHRDEVQPFVQHFPAEPALYVPDVWAAAAYGVLRDIDKDGVPDTLLVGAETDKPPTGMLLDLDQDSPRDFRPTRSTRKSIKAGTLSALVRYPQSCGQFYEHGQQRHDRSDPDGHQRRRSERWCRQAGQRHLGQGTAPGS